MATISSQLLIKDILSSDSVSTTRLTANFDFHLLHDGLISVINTLGIDAGPNINVNSVQATDIVANSFSTHLPYQPGGTFGSPYNFHVDYNGFLATQSIFSNTHVETTRLWLDPDPTVLAHAAGEVRWSGTDFLGWNGHAWVSFTGGGSTPSFTTYLFDTSMNTTPVSEYLQFSSATYASISFIYINKINAESVDSSAFIESFTSGRIRVSETNDPTKFVDLNVAGTVVQVGNVFTVPVVYINSSAPSGIFHPSDSIQLSFVAVPVPTGLNISTSPSSGSGPFYGPFNQVVGNQLQFNQMVPGSNVIFSTGVNGSTIVSVSSTSGYSGYSGKSGYSGFSGSAGSAGVSGYSGYSGKSGYSGFSGTIGASGFSGQSGASGYSGFGTSGYSGFSGKSGFSGAIGQSGFSGVSGFSGYSGYTGAAGVPGPPGTSGYSGYSGYSGIGTSGYSGDSGFSGNDGDSGFSGFSGYSGYSGAFTGASVNAASYTISPDPTGTSSPSLVMMGMGGTIFMTPVNTGILLVNITGNQATALGTTTMKIYYGTGTAPTNGVAVPGGATQAGSILVTTTSLSDTTPSDPWSGTALVGSVSIPLTVGTTYWFDIAISTTAGTVSINDVTAVIEELSGGYSGYSGYSGVSGYSGTSGYSGVSGFTGISGFSGGGGGGAFTATAKGRILPTIAYGSVVTGSDYSSILGGANNSLKYGTYNVIGGGGGNSGVSGISGSVISGGFTNIIHSPFGVIGGGIGNKITAVSLYASSYSTIGGGKNNTAVYGSSNTIAGGISNSTSGVRAVIGGGAFNKAYGQYATIGGGGGNKIYAQAGTVGGGDFNKIGYGGYVSTNSTIGGGNGNSIKGKNNAIGGGQSNRIYGNAKYSFIGGGKHNEIYGTVEYSTIIGGQNNYSSFSNTHIIGSYINANRANTTFVEALYINSSGGNAFLMPTTKGTVGQTILAPNAGTPTIWQSAVVLLGKGTGIDLNSTLPQNITLSPGTNFVVTDIVVTNTSATPTTAATGIWESNSIVIFYSNETFTPFELLVAPSNFINSMVGPSGLGGVVQFIAPYSHGGSNAYVTSISTVVFTIGTPEGSALTCDMYIYGYILS